MRRSYYRDAVVALGLIIGSPAAFAETACHASLARADATWNAIGFTTPAKPLQARVPLRDGHVSSGSEVTWLSGQLRLAAADCTQGRDTDGLHRLDLVQNRLNRL
jgi:hypothetical protein